MAAMLRMLAVPLRTLLLGRGSADPDSDFDDDVSIHLRLLTDRFVQQGMSPADAAMAARRQFGNLTLLQQERRETRTFPSIEHLWRVVRYGARRLRLDPSFTATAIVSLALGIGLTTAVFTVLDQLMLRLLPVAEPERLVMIWSPGSGLSNGRDRNLEPGNPCGQLRALTSRWI